jgi:hypothetical protein|tara:strand:- start:31 stop:309 length:279 start_codon:yes stop_codon:yes gene_type:complete
MAKKDSYAGFVEKGLINPPPTISGQRITKSPKGNIMADDVKDGPKKGDIIHGANKYKDNKGFVQDFDFTYRPSTRKSSQGDNVKHWTITGTK